ncbi:MAG: hypothetical protein IPM24_20470 [Bryobacterales bacterium]|nr:hypothetical protein [Bryobacterales bacterium]
MTVLLFFFLLVFPVAAQEAHEICASCHKLQATDFQSHPHAKQQINCGTCHGESETHSSTNGGSPPDRVPAGYELPAECGACHTDAQKDYSASKHGVTVLARGQKLAAHCGTCHGVHAPRTLAQMKVQCNRCHEKLAEPHPPVPPSETAQVCFTCHNNHTLKTAAR